MTFRYLCTLLLTIVCIAPQLGHGQSRGRAVLQGTVTSTQGEALAGANVFIPALDRGASTSPDGRFQVEGLPSQRLRVRVSFIGYETTTRTVTPQRGETTTLDVVLAPRRVQADEVVVTGTPTAQTQLTSTQDVDVVGTEQLATTRSAALGDILQESVPGVSSVKTGSQAGKPVLRGLSGNRVVLLKDGIAQQYYQFGVRHFPNTNATEAERVEVVRGASSILYGSDALGGAINVITKAAPTASEGSILIGGRAEGQYYANNNERAGALDLYGARGPVGFRAGIERRVAGNYTAPDAPTFTELGDAAEVGRFGTPKYTGEIPFTNFEQWSGYAQVGTSGAFGSVQLYADYWLDHHNFLLPNAPPEPPLGLGQNIESGNLILKGSFNAGDFVVKPRLAYQRAIRQSAGAGNTIETIEANGGFDGFDYPIDLEKDVYTGRLEVLHPAIGAVSGTVGVEASLQDGTSSGTVQLEPTSEVVNVGVFVFEEIALDPLTLSAGGRVDYLTQEATPFSETVQTLGISEDDLDQQYTTLSGSVGANYQVADGIALVSNLGAGFRAPSIFELYADGQHGGVFALQQGNPDLSPERGYTLDLSLRVQRDRLTGEVTAYQNWFTDYIYLRNTGGRVEQEGGPALPIFTFDQTNASIQGLEASLTVQARAWLEVGAQASVLASNGDELDDNPVPGQDETSDGALPLIPSDRVSGFARFVYSGAGLVERGAFEVHVRHAFGRDAAGAYEPFAQFDSPPPPPPPPFGTASTEAYTTVDLRLSGTVTVGASAVNASIGVENVFDAEYRDFLDTYKGYALSPGRDVTFRIAVPFTASL